MTVEKFYNEEYQEEDRLERHRLEFAVTVKVLLANIPQSTSLNILDIGGGPGPYTIFLAQEGHKLGLIDLSKRNIDLTQKKAMEKSLSISPLEVGDARNLNKIKDESYDCVLVMGPMYHLLKASDRQKVAKEASRILKPGGIAIFAFLSRFAKARSFAKQCPELMNNKKVFQEEVRILNDGKFYHDWENGGQTPFYFQRTEEIPDFMNSLGFNLVEMVGVEGASAELDDGLSSLTDDGFNRWVDLSLAIGRDPIGVHLSNHVLYVGKK